MPHNHSDGHSHAPKNYSTSFAVGIGLNLLFVIIEVVYGIIANSLALLADAGHNLSDVLGLVLAWGAMALSKRKPSSRFTYGLKGSSILAALGNAIFLLIAVGAMSWEAATRFAAPEHIESSTVMAVAAVGIMINAVTALLFMSGRKGDLNIQGAFLHMVADAAVSLGVVIGALIISYTNWVWIDPSLSLLIAIVITLGTWDLLKKSLGLALQAVPHGIDPVEVKSYLMSLSNVVSVHDIHIWGMSTTEAALTAHIVRSKLDDTTSFLAEATKGLHDKFHIEHPTLQVEEEGETRQCSFESDDVV